MGGDGGGRGDEVGVAAGERGARGLVGGVEGFGMAEGGAGEGE